MKKRRLGKTKLMVSQVGMGGIPITRLSKQEAIKVIRGALDLGISFIDTAHVYSDSEEKIGEAIKERREEVILSSKSNAVDKQTFLHELEVSLKRLGTDYIDIYQLHSVAENTVDKIMASGGAFDGLREVLNEGKVKHLGFSSHNMRVTKKLLQTKKFEVIQIPVNFIETEALEEIIPLAEKLDVGVIAMKPLAGGIIDDPGLAFKYLCQFDTLVPDPGVETIQEMEEIIKVVEDPSPLTVIEKQRIENIRKELGKIFCRSCDYCHPCPKNISISVVLNLTSLVKRFSVSTVVSRFGSQIEKAGDCSDCGECLTKCPYSLPIPDLLKNNLNRYLELKENLHSKLS